ncbi:EscU/YscU/HrcU family type III secretion system export apparatus switch protein [Sinomonas sp. ASV322]|uniref:EscU/YscU/HrcU family type III secretion system export apparatus switch protein n=1 Tax=Sinomonas sp. ASV322 TaxID=3041920 RepID=UPI0027DB4222|nr:EscU/YscU/HrcU family type III secretion system export apparatus switch protein [Sinomonas sp. ASV322]MDQ4504128.1 EscU/YscU/HrcU family type III secretion system export apparatus switch protein [Sinomonas sp. ASV322]
MADTQERTERATEKRLREVRSKGQLSRSQDLTAWLAVGAGALMLPSTIAAASNAGAAQLFRVRSVVASPDPGTAMTALGDGFGSLAGTVGPLAAVVFLTVLVGAAAQGGVHARRFAPSFEHFNPVAGFKRMFGVQALWGGAKALAKTAVVGLVLWGVAQGLMPVLLSAGALPLAGVLAAANDGAASLIRFAVAAGLVLAGADVFVVLRRNRAKTRMTKRELKDESKSSDGDPLIRAQRRSRQLAMSRNRMIAAIAGADVVLVNPTHVAVALAYEPGKSAPRIVAKGAGVVAARIREEAEAKRVPMVQDVPLARALHAACELGQEIPVEFYTAVAGVLAFVMALKARGAAAGLHTLPARPSLPNSRPAPTQPPGARA